MAPTAVVVCGVREVDDWDAVRYVMKLNDQVWNSRIELMEYSYREVFLSCNMIEDGVLRTGKGHECRLPQDHRYRSGSWGRFSTGSRLLRSPERLCVPTVIFVEMNS